ncbi:ATP-binding cassette domain-containing protein [Lactococcus hircilactis]|uniref:ATP-binding cassette domain-containing protein n=1 Tax=Lactococcus hircilactis TaxID=1494462 RepID=A0A7X2CZJ1_9LACT|nr:ABC transporter ATP-binding protein [Lactococcus hircilactis]MQW38364.1 ATP-binding cassette domain-containing protein [Lactococcus hircilactis]
MYIEINNINKKIKDKNIFQDVSLSFEKGSINGVIGSNGSGKTMLFRALCGFIKLDSGKIQIDSKPVKFGERPPVPIGLILETPGFILNDTALNNLKYLAEINNSYDESYVLWLLDFFSLAEYKDKKVKSFSLGMKQKLGIIQAVMEHQELIILDEPTNGIDKKSILKFNELMNQLKVEGKTIIIASHNDYEIKELCDTITEIENGAINETKRL